MRRLKRENTIFRRMTELAIAQRDEARQIARLVLDSAKKELEQAKAKTDRLEITVLPDEEPHEQNDQVDGSNQDGSGLEMPKEPVLGVRVEGEGDHQEGDQS